MCHWFYTEVFPFRFNERHMDGSQKDLVEKVKKQRSTPIEFTYDWTIWHNMVTIKIGLQPDIQKAAFRISFFFFTKGTSLILLKDIQICLVARLIIIVTSVQNVFCREGSLKATIVSLLFYLKNYDIYFFLNWGCFSSSLFSDFWMILLHVCEDKLLVKRIKRINSYLTLCTLFLTMDKILLTWLALLYVTIPDAFWPYVEYLTWALFFWEYSTIGGS